MENAKVESGDIAAAHPEQPRFTLIRSLRTFLRGLLDRIQVKAPARNNQTPDIHALLRHRRMMNLLFLILWALSFISACCIIFLSVRNSRLQNQLACAMDALVRCETTAKNHTSASNDTMAHLLTRAAANRRCLTGYTAQELVLESELLAEKYGHRAKVWMSPCSDVADINYPGGVVAEYNYVVLS